MDRWQPTRVSRAELDPFLLNSAIFAEVALESATPYVLSRISAPQDIPTVAQKGAARVVVHSERSPVRGLCFGYSGVPWN